MQKYLSKEEATARLPKGRPKGAKNKTTLFKEAMRGGFEKLLMEKGEKVFNAVVDRAIAGDMAAAKLVLDRILPTTKAIDLEDLSKSKGLVINISVGGNEGKGQVIDSDVEEVV